MKHKKRNIVIIIIILLAAAGLVFLIVSKKPQTEYSTAKVVRGNLTQTVSETGTVKAAREIELNFTTPGKITKIMAQVGNTVKQDQVLAELDNSALLINEKEAAASWDAARADLEKILAGASREEIATKEASADQAKTAYDSSAREMEKIKNTAAENLAQAEKTLSDLTDSNSGTVTAYEQAIAAAETDLNNDKSTYQQSIDHDRAASLTTVEAKNSAAKIALDNINTILIDQDAKNFLSVRDLSLIAAAKEDYDNSVKLFTPAQTSLEAAQNNQTNNSVALAAKDSLSLLNKTFAALKNCYNLLENSSTGTTFSQTKLDAYKTSISAQQTAIAAAIAALETARNSLNDSILAYTTNVASAEKSLAKARTDYDDALLAAKNSLASVKVSGLEQITAAQTKVDNGFKAWQVALAQLNQLKSPARPEDINLKQAQVARAQASLDLIRQQINDSGLKAPIDGTITKKNYEIGEQTTAAKPVFLMLGVNNFEIELDVSEADISKVNLNNPADITLDAFGSEAKFSGKVYFIEPAETVIQDVIYYKVKISFDFKDRNVKSGMTANAVITTNRQDNILILPSRAVIEKNGSKLVRILRAGRIEESLVTLGLRGDEGMVQALSGVKEGDEVVTFVKNGK